MAKDYALTGKTGQEAEASGLANVSWYRPKVDLAAVRALMEKSDSRAARDTALWLGSMIILAVIIVAIWPSWWAVPFLLVYGVLYGSGADARWHEHGHNTAFKTSLYNDIVYHIASFMMMRNPITWRASHVRHHTDTIVVGRDPEIQLMRPPDLAKWLLNFAGLPMMWDAVSRIALHASGKLDPNEKTYLREDQHTRVILIARIWVAIYMGVLLTALLTWSILPLLLIGGPRIYGAWQHVMTGSLQHLGLAENVTDHRLNTRTVLMNPWNRFLYLNMNYHIEHHMFTMVPYYNLPALHDLVKHDLPAPDPSILAAYKRLVPVLWKQLQDKEAVIVPDLPETATPYREEVEVLRAHAV